MKCLKTTKPLCLDLEKLEQFLMECNDTIITNHIFLFLFFCATAVNYPSVAFTGRLCLLENWPSVHYMKLNLNGIHQCGD